MSINSQEQFEMLRACGMIVAKALRAMSAEVRAGVTTAELCEIGSRVLAVPWGRSSPAMVYGFPGDVCISVNEEVVHGIPGDRVIQPIITGGTAGEVTLDRDGWTYRTADGSLSAH
jgi:methionyl aminopeptidase